MKIESLEIRNYKAIEYLKLEELKDIVIIAGGNGVGKSTIFNVLRLLKSSYGEYNQNEIQQWFSEFNINNREREKFNSLLRKTNYPLLLEVSFSVTQNEKNYLKDSGLKLIQSILWRSKTKKYVDPDSDFFESITSENRAYLNQIQSESSILYSKLLEELRKDSSVASLKYVLDGDPITEENILFQILCSVFIPEKLGVIDYHGPDRVFGREYFDSLNVNFNHNEILRNNALYNHNGKYSSIKSELASSYVKALIAREAGEEGKLIVSLEDSLNDLFDTFFPNKHFMGIKPQKNGLVEFPVTVNNEIKHDISDLSSGEKEILFGYLRLKNSSPPNSIILIDEPELHLNPKIAKKLPHFYYRNLSKGSNNQIWLVTHSEAIIRETLGYENFSLFHLKEPSNHNNQTHKITVSEDVELALIDLVGEFSNYSENKPIVIFEGTDSKFDETFVQKIFPEFESKVMSISVGKKANVKSVHAILHEAYEKKILKNKCISIVDRDNDKIYNDTTFTWDVYHIENYLINPKYILKALQTLDMSISSEVDTEIKVEGKLKEIAISDIDFHAWHIQNEKIQNKLLSKIKTNFNHCSDNSRKFREALNQVLVNIQEVIHNEFELEQLRSFESSIRNDLKAKLDTLDWHSNFRGRSILKLFQAKYVKNGNYEAFRNVIINEMRNDSFQPAGMKKVIDKILN